MPLILLFKWFSKFFFNHALFDSIMKNDIKITNLHEKLKNKLSHMVNVLYLIFISWVYILHYSFIFCEIFFLASSLKRKKIIGKAKSKSQSHNLKSFFNFPHKSIIFCTIWYFTIQVSFKVIIYHRKYFFLKSIRKYHGSFEFWGP